MQAVRLSLFDFQELLVAGGDVLGGHVRVGAAQQVLAVEVLLGLRPGPVGAEQAAGGDAQEPVQARHRGDLPPQFGPLHHGELVRPGDRLLQRVNTGGVTLTVFELLTATFAADEFDLRRHWEKECQGAWSGPEYRILREVANTDFLQAVTLLATAARRAAAAAEGQDDERLPRIGCKRDDMLKLTLDEYQRFAPAVVNGSCLRLLRCASRLLLL